jgi:hypothetical protein
MTAARVSAANEWRHRYRRAPDATRGMQPLAVISDAMRSGDRKRQREQADFLRRNGFVGADAELGNELVVALRRRADRFPLSHLARRIAGQLAAVGEFNFQGVWRIAKLVGCHRRTVQRARKELERFGLIESVLLHAGDKLPSQRAPVWRLQVVRDCRELRGIVRRGARLTYAESMRPRPSRAPSAAERPAPSSPPSSPPSSAHYFELAAVATRNGAPWLAALHTSTAVALRKREAAAEAEATALDAEAEAEAGCNPQSRGPP